MRSGRKPAILILVIAAICGFSSVSDAKQFLLKVSAKVDCVDVPVHTVIDLPEPFANLPADEIEVIIRQISRGGARIYGKPMPGQIIRGSDTKAQLWWVMPGAKAGSVNRWTVILKRKEKEDKKTFSWQDKEGEYMDLLFDGRKVTRYMYAYDTSTPQRIFETYKPLHHVFDAEGKNLLTNGPDGEHEYTKRIKFPHHRGIFIGWNRLEFGGKRYDFWHMGEQGRAQKHERFLELTAGPVLARSNSLVHWNNKDGLTIISEQRKTTVFRQSEPTILLLEFVTDLKAVNGDVMLDGDPEHAGFQYRPHDGVAKGGKDVKATYLFHKEVIDPKKDKDLPWVAMSCGLNGRRYSILHMNHTDNPKQTLYSAYRDYGRFGAFFKKKVGAGETLTLRYRILVVEGEMPKRFELAKEYSEFVDGPKVEVLD